MAIAPEIMDNVYIAREIDFAMNGIVEHQEALGLTANQHVIFWDTETHEPYVGEHIDRFTMEDFSVLESDRIARDGVDISLVQAPRMSAA